MSAEILFSGIQLWVAEAHWVLKFLNSTRLER